MSTRIPRPVIISGGQTGVDRGALDAALSLEWPCGGTCPAGRRAEDGPIPARYPLVESGSASWDVRTRINVEDADATLILAGHLPLSGGTRLTRDWANAKGKPVHVETQPWDHAVVVGWVRSMDPEVLNVAGPRESGAPGIGRAAMEFIRNVLLELGQT